MKKYIVSTSVAAAMCALFSAVDHAAADGAQDLFFQQAQQRYFNQPQNARSFGMAGSVLETQSDSASVVSNPAGLGFMKRGDASISYGFDNISGNENSTYEDVEQQEDSGQTLLAIPLGPYADDYPEFGNLGFGWSGYDSDVDSDPFDAQTDGYRVTGAYSKALSETWSVGYSLAYFNDTYENDLSDYSMNDGFRNTLGVANKVSSDLTVGASAFWGFGSHDLEVAGSTDEFESDQDEFGFGVGAQYQVAPETLVAFGLDYQTYDSDGDVESGDPAVVFGGDEDGDAFNVRLGVEQTITDWFKARAGYQYAANLDYDADRLDLDDRDGSAKYSGWSLGAGMHFPLGAENYIEAINVDYGVQYRAIADGDWQHIVTVSAPFSPCD